MMTATANAGQKTIQRQGEEIASDSPTNDRALGLRATKATRIRLDRTKPNVLARFPGSGLPNRIIALRRSWIITSMLTRSRRSAQADPSRAANSPYRGRTSARPLLGRRGAVVLNQCQASRGDHEPPSIRRASEALALTGMPLAGVIGSRVA